MGIGVDDRVGRDSEDRAVAERDAAGEPRQDIDRHRQHGVDQDLDREAQLIIREHQRQQRGGSDRDRGDQRRAPPGDRADPKRRRRSRRHVASWVPNRPSGRNASSTAIGPKITKYASSGNSTWPKVLSRPTNRLPTAAPTRL